jgi:hypothetical protein
MTATYTFDVFSSLDGFGGASGDWTGYWGNKSHASLSMNRAVMAAGFVERSTSRSSASSRDRRARIRSSWVRPTSTSS